MQPNYPCTTFGELMIPFFSLVEDPENPYREHEVKVNPIAEPFIIPDEAVRKFAKENIDAKEKKMKDEGKQFVNNPTARLNAFTVIDEDNHTLELSVQKSDFFTNEMTNKSLDNDIVWRMVEKRGSQYANLDDGLGNAIGNSILVRSKPDNAVFLNKRSENISQYPGLYGILPAGFTNPDKDNYSMFNTARREAIEELGIRNIKNIQLLGIGRAGDDRHVEFNFLAETDYTVKEVLSTPKTARYEAAEIIPVEFEPDKLAPYLVKTVSDVPKGAVRRGNAWIPGRSPASVPAQGKIVIDALIKEYGFDKTYKAIDDAFHKYNKKVA